MSRRRHGSDWFFIGALLIVGTLLRLALASGYGLGDDGPFFAPYSAIARSGVFDPGEQYSLRFGTWLPVVASLRLLGQTEVGFLAPILIASVVNLLLVYSIARDEWDRAAARCAMALLAVLPLEVLCATVFAPDVMLATWMFGSYWCLRRALRTDRSVRRWLFALGAGLTFFVGFISKPWVAFVIPLLAWEALWRGRRRLGVLAVAAVAAIAPAAALCAWQAARFGDPLHQLTMTRRMAAFEPYSSKILLDYPHMLLWPTEYGSFFAGWYPHLLIVLAILCARSAYTAGKWLLYSLIVLLGLAAMPSHWGNGQWQTLSPHIFRYLTLLSIPLCLALTAYLRVLWTRWPRVGRALMTALLALSLWQSVELTAPTRDAFAETRQASVLLASYPDDTLYLDRDLGLRVVDFVLVDRGFERAIRLAAETPEAQAAELGAIQEGLIVTGGARLPWYGCLRCVAHVDGWQVPAHWTLLKQLDAPLTAYRREPLRLWRASVATLNATAISADVPTAAGRAALVRELLAQNRPLEALAIGERLPLTADPQLSNLLGRACQDARRPFCAIRYLKTAAATTSDRAQRQDALGRLILAYTNERVADPDKARRAYAALTRQFPETANDPNLRLSVSPLVEGRQLLHQDRLTAARAALERVTTDPLATPPELIDAQYYLALIAFRERRIDDGVALREAYRRSRGENDQWLELCYREAAARRWVTPAVVPAQLQALIARAGASPWGAEGARLLNEVLHAKRAAFEG